MTTTSAIDTREDEDTQDNEIDDQFRVLLEGLRTSLPGVQVLFAFLLTAPLQSGFADLGSAERAAFAIAFYASGAASILLIAPSVHQRLRAPSTGMRRRSETHLAVATWITIAGTVAMGVAITSTIYLVSRLVFDDDPATLAAAFLLATLAWSWFYLPLVSFRRRPDTAASQRSGSSS